MNLLNARSHQAAREPTLLSASMRKRRKKNISRELMSEHFLDGNENCLSAMCLKSLALSGQNDSVLHIFFFHAIVVSNEQSVESFCVILIRRIIS